MLWVRNPAVCMSASPTCPALTPDNITAPLPSSAARRQERVPADERRRQRCLICILPGLLFAASHVALGPEGGRGGGERQVRHKLIIGRLRISSANAAGKFPVSGKDGWNSGGFVFWCRWEENRKRRWKILPVNLNPPPARSLYHRSIKSF